MERIRQSKVASIRSDTRRRGFRAFASVAVMAIVSVAATSTSLAFTRARLVWSARYDGPVHADDVTAQDVTSPDGSTVFVTGTSPSSHGNDITTVAYAAATGAKLWLARYDGPAQSIDQAWGVAITPDGSTVLVTGQSIGVSTNYDYVTLGYDTITGVQLWEARYDGPIHSNDTPITLQASLDGSMVFVTGTSVGLQGNQDFLTVAYHTSDGSGAWVSRYDGPGHSDDATGALDVGPNGVLYIMGGSTGVGTGGDIATVAYNPANGHKLWVARYDGPLHTDENNCILTCVEASADGSRVFVLGQTPGPGTGQDIVTIAYQAANGSQDWATRFDGPAHGDDFPGDLTVLPNSSAVISSGSRAGQGTFDDVVTIEYGAASGARQWVATYDGPSHGEDYANTIVTTPSGNAVVLTGNSNNNGSNDATGRDAIVQSYATSDGHLRWSARYDSPAHSQDDGWFVVLSPDGMAAYAVGDTTGPTGSLDYLTLAYRVP